MYSQRSTIRRLEVGLFAGLSERPELEGWVDDIRTVEHMRPFPFQSNHRWNTSIFPLEVGANVYMGFNGILEVLSRCQG